MAHKWAIPCALTFAQKMKYLLFAVIIPFHAMLCFGQSQKIGWIGEVTYIYDFKAGALPPEIKVGSKVSGFVEYDPDGYGGRSWILGNLSGGYIYRFQSNLSHEIYIERERWMLQGGEYTIAWSNLDDSPFIDFFSTSENGGTPIEFPGLVGKFEYGFFISDKEPPYELHQSVEIENPGLDLSKMTRAKGFLNSRLWDDSGNIIDGFYLEFEVSRAELGSIPIHLHARHDEKSVFVRFSGEVKVSSNLVDWTSVDPQPTSPWTIELEEGQTMFIKTEEASSEQVAAGNGR